MDVHFPFVIDGNGQVAEADRPAHLRQMIEQVLFTTPGERVNRPDFGCGLLRMVFGVPSREEMVALQFLVSEALQRWLGELIEVRDVGIEQHEETLHVRVEYLDREAGRAEAATFEVSAA